MTEHLPPLSAAALSRYSRHLQLEQIGVRGQQRIAAARVLVIGAGGLGSPAALYLAAAGVGTLGIADFDRVAVHNLQRQLLHDTDSVDQLKTASAATRLRRLNPLTTVVEHPTGITPDNAVALFGAYDVIVDGTDNFTARYLNNDAAFRAGKPLVYGSVYKFEGEVTVFASASGTPCYRCLFPQRPPAGAVPDCGEAGVLGAVCGVIGSLQALEAIKLVTGIGTTLRGTLLTYDCLTHAFQTLRIPRDPGCELCGTSPARHATSPAPCTTSGPTTKTSLTETTVVEAKALLDDPASQARIVDVREPWELDICQIAGATCIPMGQIAQRLGELPRDRPLLIFCHHGARSRRVTEFLRAQGYRHARNVEGGIAAWADAIDPSLRRY